MSKEVKQYIGTLQKRIANQRTEIERLHAVIEELTIKCNAWHLTAERVGEELQAIKADTVRKMQMSLKASAYGTFDDDNCFDGFVVDVDDIDQIAKELLEGEK
jgi:hypothetical protein